MDWVYIWVHLTNVNNTLSEVYAIRDKQAATPSQTLNLAQIHQTHPPYVRLRSRTLELRRNLRKQNDPGERNSQSPQTTFFWLSWGNRSPESGRRTKGAGTSGEFDWNAKSPCGKEAKAAKNKLKPAIGHVGAVNHQGQWEAVKGITLESA